MNVCALGVVGKVISCSFFTAHTHTHNFFRLNYIKQANDKLEIAPALYGKKELNPNMQITQLTVQ